MLLNQTFGLLSDRDLSFDKLQVPGRGLIHDFFRPLVQQWVKRKLCL